MPDEYKDKIDKELSNSCAQQLKRLETIHKQKLDWMNQFDRNYEQKPHEEAMNYLLEKKTAIEQIKQSFLSEMDKADELLKKVTTK